MPTACPWSKLWPSFDAPFGNDVEWLGLREGEDFESMIDLAGVTRIWNPQYKNYTVYGQDHIARHLLNWDTSASHDAVG